ncbi:MAG: PAS domain S-box protein [Methanobacteriaceae archaeon]|nr:PAS domain S-box protein [Methanobacteriaceae archaeon]
MLAKKILLVEDECIEALDIKRTLESFGYEVPYIASSGEETVDKALKIMPDLILMDIILKGESNGINDASKIKEINIPIIYLTANLEESTIEKAKFTEPYDYIIKPYDPIELKYAIELAIYKTQTEKELKQSEKRFRHILENSLDAAYRRNLDIDEYDYLSPVIEQVLGYSAEEFISLPSTKVLELIHPHDRENADNIFANALSGKTKTYNIEYRFKQKDGHYKWVKDFGSIVQDEDIMFLIGSVHDINERKKGEEARKKGEERRKKGEKSLRESEEKYKTLFESDPDYTILVGLDGTILDFNAAAEQITGKHKEELVGKNYMELEIFPKEDIDLLEEKFSDLFKNEDVAPFECRILDRNGVIRWGETSLTIIKKDNAPAYILLISSDITERKQAENKIIQSLQEKEVLIREIHHRVKNNMQIISSLLNLQMQHEDLDETVNVLKESQGRVKSMAMIHEKLYQSPNFTDINFKEYIDKLVVDIFYSYGIKIGTIESVLDIEDINLNIETAISLGLIVNEIVTNIVKYAFPKGEGTITINLKSLPDRMQLTIRDDGIGLPEDIDIENTETLGFQLVNSLVSQIDGKIELDRINGTEFKITFKELKYNERL